MRFHPRNKRVLVRPTPPIQETKSGLILTETGPDVMGEVVEKAEDVTDLEVGETIIFPTFVGQEIRLQDERFLVMNEEDVTAIVTADPVNCPYCRRPLEANS